MPRLSPSLTYTKVFDSEAAAMRGLEGWVRDLFYSLVRQSDYRSGAGRTTYAHLRELLTPTAERGRAVFAPSVDQLRRAVDKLESRGLLSRNHQANLHTKVLIFQLLPRTVGESALFPNSPVNSGVVLQREKGANSPVNSPGIHKGISLLNTHSAVDKLATSVDKAAPVPDAVRELQARLHREDGGAHGQRQGQAANPGRAATPGAVARADRAGRTPATGAAAAGGAVPAAAKKANVGHGGTG